MFESVYLDREEKVSGRPFVDPEHSLEDLAVMRHMARQLVENYGDPVVCDFGPGKKPVCQSDPQGRHFRIYYVRADLLFSLKAITAVGFFGEKRKTADIQPLIRADKKFETAFNEHPGLLSLSTVRLSNGDFGNLVLFTTPQARDAWANSQLHRELVAKISPPYYRSIRLNNAMLPQGVAEPDDINLVRVKYIDYDSDPPWRAVRELDN